MKLQRIYTGHGDATIMKTPWGLQFESLSKDVAKEVFKVAKKEKTEDGYTLTSTDGEEWEFYGGSQWNKEYDDDDMKLVRKGSVAGLWNSMDESKLIAGFTPDYLEKTLNKYFVEA